MTPVIFSRSKTARSALILAAMLAVVSVVFLPKFNVIAILVATISLMLLAAGLSKAGHSATSLQSFEGRSVEVRVWGAPIRDGDRTSLRIESVTAFGAALLIFVRSASGKRILLKVAQPAIAQVNDTNADIVDARYVSWGGKKLPHVAGLPAVAMSTRNA